jgi:hypothetical protein
MQQQHRGGQVLINASSVADPDPGSGAFLPWILDPGSGAFGPSIRDP